MLLEPSMNALEMLNDLTKRGFVASDDRTYALLVRGEDFGMPLTPLRGERQQGHAPILRSRRALDEVRALQSVRDCRDVALISEQQSTEVNHGQAVGLAQVMQGPELSGAQAVLTKELAIGVVQQVEQVSQQQVQFLLWSLASR